MSKRQHITEEQGIHKEWYVTARTMKPEGLDDFIHHLMDDYSHDYGTICHALTAGGIATMWAMNSGKQGGITGFQAGAVMWEFIRNWMSIEGNMKLVQYNDMLYPQYENKFAKTITTECFHALQDKAREKLVESGMMHNRVQLHMQSIVDGVVPFGYTLGDD